jgi:hypothetical protein
MARSDIKTKRLTGTGAVGIGRARIRQLQVTVTNAGAGRLTITDGNGGETILDLDFKADDTHSVNIPSDGVLSTNDPYVSAATNVSALTVFYA